MRAYMWKCCLGDQNRKQMGRFREVSLEASRNAELRHVGKHLQHGRTVVLNAYPG